jgi:hypothetical protein
MMDRVSAFRFVFAAVGVCLAPSAVLFSSSSTIKHRMTNCFRRVLDHLAPGTDDHQGVDAALFSILTLADATASALSGSDSYTNAATTSLAILRGKVTDHAHLLLSQLLSDLERKIAAGQVR